MKFHFSRSFSLFCAFLISGLLCGLDAGRLHAQEPFEGTIHFTLKTPLLDEDEHDVAVNWKKGNSEAEVDAGMQGKIRIIKDDKAKKQYFIMEEMKMGMVSDLSQVPVPDDSKDLDMKPTGKHETIAGHVAEEYVVNVKDAGDMHIWLSKDFPQEVFECFMQTASIAGGASQTKIFQQIKQNHQVCVRMIAKFGGKEVFKLEFVKLERKKVDDKIFVVPTDINLQPTPSGFPGTN